MRRAPLLLAVLGLAACGGARAERPAATPAMSADERQIRETIDRFAAAVRRDDAHAACALLAEEAQRVIRAAGARCEEVFGGEIGKGGPRFSITTTSVRIAGDRATTRGRELDDGRRRSGDQALVKENGRWRLTTKTP